MADPVEGVAPSEPVVPVEPVAPTEQVPTEPIVTPEVVPETPAVTPDENAYTPVEEAVSLSDIKIDGHDVEINIPADILNFVGEKGLDAAEIAKEMYSEGGVTEETREKLNEAFGKWQVDAYLDGIAAKNQLTMSEYKSGVEASQKAETEAWESTLEIMGGEDRWDDLSSFAEESLSEVDFEAFNSIMENGSLMVQQVLITDLYSKFTEAGAPVAPQIPELEQGETGGDAGSVGEKPLSVAEYKELFTSGEYSKATKEEQRRFDQLRELGQSKGI